MHPTRNCPLLWPRHGSRWRRTGRDESVSAGRPEHAPHSSAGMPRSIVGNQPCKRSSLQNPKSDTRVRLAPKASGAIAFGSVFTHQLKGGTLREKPKGSVIGGVSRSVRLLKGFRTQYDDPDGFYTMLADDTVELVGEYHPVAAQRVVDVGGGPGYFAQAFRRAGAKSVFVEPFWESMTASGQQLGYGVIGDGLSLPFPDGAFDISHSSNVIEHVVDPENSFTKCLGLCAPAG